MLTRDKLVELIDKHDLSEYKDFILQHSKPAIHLTREFVPNEDDLPIGASKIGGNPDLPADFEWPYADGRPLYFMLQIQLADIKDIDTENQLPDTGWLYIFYDFDRVPIYNEYEDKEGIVFHDVRESKNLIRYKHPEQDGTYRYIRALPSLKIVCHHMLTLPILYDFHDEIEYFEEETQNLLAYHYLDLLSEIGRLYKPLHYILGIANSIQEELSIQAWNERDRKLTNYKPDPLIEQWLNAPDKKWRLLFQIDSDYAPESHGDISFVGSGRLYIMIRQGDLTKRRFKNAHFIVQHT